MIVGTINSQIDAGLMLKMNKVLTFLQSTNLNNLPVGQIVLEPDSIFVYVQEYTTKPFLELPFEAHKKFIDMQVLVSGEEIIAFAPRENLKAQSTYDKDKDIVFFEEPEEFGSIPLHPGDFAVMGPKDAHKPRCNMNQACPVKKIVVKIHI